MDWDKLRVFHAVAEAGSFTHAGETPEPEPVRRVTADLGPGGGAAGPAVSTATPAASILTEQGEQLNRTVREVFAKLAITEGSC